jgi:hypothetical protein
MGSREGQSSASRKQGWSLFLGYDEGGRVHSKKKNSFVFLFPIAYYNAISERRI